MNTIYPPITMTASAAPKTVAELLLKAFNEARPARSLAYRQGVKAKLERHFGQRPALACPYVQGTAEMDAFFAGVDEGNAIVRSL